VTPSVQMTLAEVPISMDPGRARVCATRHGHCVPAVTTALLRYAEARHGEAAIPRWLRSPWRARRTQRPTAGSLAPRWPARRVSKAGSGRRHASRSSTLTVRFCSSPRIGPGRAFSLPWSHSISLLAYRSVWCQAAGASAARLVCSTAAALLLAGQLQVRRRGRQGRCRRRARSGQAPGPCHRRQPCHRRHRPGRGYSVNRPLASARTG
jgi:hypothetical protein